MTDTSQDRFAFLDQLDQDLNLIEQAPDGQALEVLRLRWLGRQGFLTQAFKQMGSLTQDERQEASRRLNEAKRSLQQVIGARKAVLAAEAEARELEASACDVTLPGRQYHPQGHLHPITQVIDRMATIMERMGFTMTDGPEIEDEAHNFSALNIPEHHPARASHDTFYLQSGALLRTHTSPVQIRAMKDYGSPLRIGAIGRVYRCDSDHTHTPVFHQMEGLVIDHHTSFADLKGFLTTFLSAFFERDVQCRYRPSYFPFTEPSCEVDMACFACDGAGCRVCGHSGWVEVLGCGMVHPHVLEAAGLDSDTVQGYAFGMGVERLVMFYFGLDDIRKLYESDVRFLQLF